MGLKQARFLEIKVLTDWKGSGSELITLLYDLVPAVMEHQHSLSQLDHQEQQQASLRLEYEIRGEQNRIALVQANNTLVAAYSSCIPTLLAIFASKSSQPLPQIDSPLAVVHTIAMLVSNGIMSLPPDFNLESVGLVAAAIPVASNLLPYTTGNLIFDALLIVKNLAFLSRSPETLVNEIGS